MALPTVPILVDWVEDAENWSAVAMLPELVMVPEHVFAGSEALDGVDVVSEWLSDTFDFVVAGWRRL